MIEIRKLVTTCRTVFSKLEAHDYLYVLETGRVVLEGLHRALVADDRVRRADLGMSGE
jgi:branched-chain amino acid transport system ATP-binding protein